MDAQDRIDLGLLQALRLKGRLSEDMAARLAGAGAWTRLAALAQAGLVTMAPVGARLAAPGRERLACLIETERSGVDGAALRQLYEERFDNVNHALKAVVTSWQVKPSGTANDHADAAYDAAVIARLATVHAEARPVLEEVAWLVPRLAPYPDRLAYALAQVQAGDAAYLTHPLRESYHQLWFELHEELLALLGLQRVDEAKAGRA
ncbi:MAG TPA: MarR family transcriptional regulator [Candidatus Limnocylindria bacterium]|nr:MarR family transcriptional regulator [Candidatus Limnocylindria bacterium]